MVTLVLACLLGWAIQGLMSGSLFCICLWQWTRALQIDTLEFYIFSDNIFLWLRYKNHLYLSLVTKVYGLRNENFQTPRMPKILSLVKTGLVRNKILCMNISCIIFKSFSCFILTEFLYRNVELLTDHKDMAPERLPSAIKKGIQHLFCDSSSFCNFVTIYLFCCQSFSVVQTCVPRLYHLLELNQL